MIISTLSFESHADATVCDPKSKACMCSTYVESSDKSMYVGCLSYREVQGDTSTIVGQQGRGLWLHHHIQGSHTLYNREVGLDSGSTSSTSGTSMQHTERLERNMSMMLIHIDFADNYVRSYAAESQSLHFGGAHDQAILHTGVAYVNNRDAPFCTISDSKDDSRETIWTYLSPVFPWLEQQVPQGFGRLNAFRDGPVTHYRKKKNFFLSDGRALAITQVLGSKQTERQPFGMRRRNTSRKVR